MFYGHGFQGFCSVMMFFAYWWAVKVAFSKKKTVGQGGEQRSGCTLCRFSFKSIFCWPCEARDIVNESLDENETYTILCIDGQHKSDIFTQQWPVLMCSFCPCSLFALPCGYFALAHAAAARNIGEAELGSIPNMFAAVCCPACFVAGLKQRLSVGEAVGVQMLAK